MAPDEGDRTGRGLFAAGETVGAFGLLFPRPRPQGAKVFAPLF
jgi:hypothetical protein